MSQFAENLPDIAPDYLQLPVVDATGMSGNWVVTLMFTPGVRQAIVTSEDKDPKNDVTIFDAAERQLGLKLRRQQSPLSVLVVDRVEMQPK